MPPPLGCHRPLRQNSRQNSRQRSLLMLPLCDTIAHCASLRPQRAQSGTQTFAQTFATDAMHLVEKSNAYSLAPPPACVACAPRWNIAKWLRRAVFVRVAIDSAYSIYVIDIVEYFM